MKNQTPQKTERPREDMKNQSGNAASSPEKYVNDNKYKKNGTYYNSNFL